MKKQLQQFRYFGDQSSKTSTGLTKDNLISGSIFPDSIVALGIQTYPGVKFYLNGADEPIIIGSSGIFEIDLTDNFSIYMKVKINSDVQHIIDIKTDKVDMYLNWEKTYFKFGSKTLSSPFYFYHEYSPYQPTTNGMLPANYLSDNLSKQQEHLNLELASGQFISNISFPWMWQDNLIWNDDYFWHDESILDNSWWEIIITYSENGRLCAFFKNMLSDTKWTGILTKSGSDINIEIGGGGIDYPILKDGV